MEPRREEVFEPHVPDLECPQVSTGLEYVGTLQGKRGGAKVQVVHGIPCIVVGVIKGEMASYKGHKGRSHKKL